jgi:hypothetical protein
MQINRGTSAMEFYVNGATRATISSTGVATFSGKVKVSDGGNTTIPSLRVGSDTNGLSAPSTNQLNFITNSLTRLSISSGGLATFSRSPMTTEASYNYQNIKVTSGFGGGYNNSRIQSLLAGYDSTIYGVDLGYAYNGAGYNLIFSTNDNTSGNPIERLTITSGGDTTFSGTITANGSGNHAIGGNLYMASGTSIFTQGTGRVYTHNVTLREQDNTAKFQIYSSGGGCVFYNSESNGAYYFYTNGSPRLTIASGGVATFSGHLISTHTSGVTNNSTSHAYLTSNSSAASKASWVNHAQGGTSRWLAGVEGNETDYQLYSPTGTKFRITASGAATLTPSHNGDSLTINNTGTYAGTVAFNQNGTNAGYVGSIRAFEGNHAADNGVGLFSRTRMSFYINSATPRLTISSTGEVSMPFQPSARAYKNTILTEGTGNNFVTGWYVQHNIGGDLATTGSFTCSKAGRYLCTFSPMSGQTSGDVQFRIYKNSTLMINSNSMSQAGSGGAAPWRQTTITGVIDCAAGDVLKPAAYSSASSSTPIVYGGNYSQLSFHFLG